MISFVSQTRVKLNQTNKTGAPSYRIPLVQNENSPEEQNPNQNAYSGSLACNIDENSKTMNGRKRKDIP